MDRENQSRDRREKQELLNSYKGIAEAIIGCAFKVRNNLGSGFLEKVYENALAYEIKKNGLHVQQQFPAPVYYDGIAVGEYYVDLLVEE